MCKKMSPLVLPSSLLCVLCLGSPLHAEQEFHLSNEYSLTYNSVSGPGASQSSAGIISRTVLQDIKVLSAGTDIQTDAQGKPHQVPVVNLLVTPKQAQILSLASSQQVRILLVLRNPLDTKINKIPVTAMSQLFGSAPAQRIYRSRPSPQVYSIVVYNGAQQTQQKVTPPGGMH